MKDIIKKIETLDIFNNMNKNEINEILKNIPHRTISYPKNKLISIKDINAKDILILIDGKLKSELISYGGRVLKMKEIVAPQMIAMSFLFGNNSTMPFTLTVIKKATVLYLSKKYFITTLQTNLSLLLNYLQAVSKHFLFLSQKIDFLYFNTISKKLAFYLLNLHSDQQDCIILSLSIRELAEFFGVERPSLSKVLGDFVKEKIIERISRRKFKIINKKKLENILK